MTVRLQAPGDARGFYAAGLLIRTKDNTPKVKPGEMGVGFVVQFLVMIMVNIAGPQAKEVILPQNIGIDAVESGTEHTAEDADRAAGEK